MQDADRIVEKAGKVLDELLEKHPDAERIGLTGQMHGMVYVDENGKAAAPLCTWEDKRAGQPEEDGRSVVDHLREDHGLKVSAGYGISTHCYQFRHGAVPETAVSFCTIPDYLGMYLTGRKSPLPCHG